MRTVVLCRCGERLVPDMISQREMHDVVNRIFGGADNRAHLLPRRNVGSSFSLSPHPPTVRKAPERTSGLAVVYSCVLRPVLVVQSVWTFDL